MRGRLLMAIDIDKLVDLVSFKLAACHKSSRGRRKRYRQYKRADAAASQGESLGGAFGRFIGASLLGTAAQMSPSMLYKGLFRSPAAAEDIAANPTITGFAGDVSKTLNKAGIEHDLFIRGQHIDPATGNPGTRILPELSGAASKDLSHAVGEMTGTHPGRPFVTDGNYNAFINLADNHAGILGHEAGHLRNMKDLSKLLGSEGVHRAYRIMRSPGLQGVSGLAAAAVGGLASKDSFAGQNAWALPLLAGLPVVSEEGIASLRGLNMLRKSQGLLSALKASPRLGAALGTYMGAGAGGALTAYLLNRWKPGANGSGTSIVNSGDKPMVLPKPSVSSADVSNGINPYLAGALRAGLWGAAGYGLYRLLRGKKKKKN